MEIGRIDIWPVEPVSNAWSEEAIFDFLEFLGRKVSSPVPGSGNYHSWNDCGWHDQEFSLEPARGQYVQRVNTLLKRYRDGWEMTPGFEIVELTAPGMDRLLAIQLPVNATADVRHRVQAAVSKYRRRSASPEERRDAVRDLGDVLESLRPEAENVISKKDDSDLFNILNNFSIRHNNKMQKSEYDPIWLAGLFYHFLAMIHVITHLLDRNRVQASSATDGTAVK